MAIKTQIENVVISIDPGESTSGMAVIAFTGLFQVVSISGFIMDNELLIGKITSVIHNCNSEVVIEDMKPYSGKLSPSTITTCKFIGELCYRLKSEVGVKYSLISRNEVRKWVFEAFSDICIARIDKKIAYLDDYGERKGRKRYRNKDGGLRKASFHYVDDRIVIAAMKKHWAIPDSKPGKPNVYGFKEHSWQALAVGSCFLQRNTKIS